MEGVDTIGCFKTILDPYNGITIESKSLPLNAEEFAINLELLLKNVKEKRNLIWIYIDISKSDFIPLATSKGFFFHSCDENYILLVKRLKENAIIPTAANHTLGVGAVVINDKNELLVIKERLYTNQFKLPGGHIDNTEMIPNALVREVYEETGIDVKFESIVFISHLYPHQFHKSNLYIACVAKPLSFKIDVQDTCEIEEAKWLDVDKFLDDEKNSEFSKNVVRQAISSKGFVIRKPDFMKNFSKNVQMFFPS